ncbi:MAG: putative ferredoxin [Gammaproteobacteria bacterium]|jgi:ferredoxin|nr:putative ferredoxin [Gammaproteobacteria bacterium]
MNDLSSEARPRKAGPREAALLAAAAEPMPEVPVVVLKSEGVVLIYGCDEHAIEAGDLLEEYLDVTVLLTPPAAAITQRRSAFPGAGSPGAGSPGPGFPVARGAIRSAKGHLGAFEITVDDFAQPEPSTGETVSFGASRDGARSHCDIILDLSGKIALFSAGDLRDGYLRAHPGDKAGMLEAVLKARDLIGTFEKPRYITFTEQLCAHSRSHKTGCTRCLDLCPAGAIAPAGDHVMIDPNICAGCGQCASACPTGAASYTVPPSDALMRKLRTLLLAYARAGGEHAIVLVHDEPHGAPLIDALARSEEGLPARVLPFAVNEITQVGLETIAAAFIFGASALRFLLRGRARHDVSGLSRTLALAEPILGGLGFGVGRVATIETDDPDTLVSTLAAIPEMGSAPRTSSFLALGGDKQGVLRLVLRELHRVAPAPVDVLVLPPRAPFGSVDIDVAGCTLCLACVSACPTGALSDNADQPMLRFTEVACIQCGLCEATCPEKVITLKPQLDFRPETTSARTIKAEQPFCCIRCGKAFGVRSTIERVTAKLAGQHWMYKDSKRLDLIKMCDDCRVAFVTEENFDPYAPPRAPVRTTDDYLRERDEGKPAEDEA